jgi:Ca-activated chloride channel family protein
VTFQSPVWLWALLALPFLAAALAAWGRASRNAAHAYADPRVMRVGPAPPARRLRAGAAGLALLAVAAGAVAMARPSVATEHEERRSAVVIALDVSRSMLKDDLAPTRLAAAVDAAGRFARAAPKDTAVGLVTFANRAQVALAPTTDRDAVQRALDGIGEPREGTALGEAVVVALGSLRSFGALDPLPARPEDAAGRVLVLTDGANSIRRPVATPAEATARAASERVPVYTILLGDDPGRPDQATPSEILGDMSARTGGIHAQTTTAADLRRVFADIGGIVAPVEALDEQTVWVALAALLLMLSAAGLAGLAGLRDARRAPATAAGLSPPR